MADFAAAYAGRYLPLGGGGLQGMSASPDDQSQSSPSLTLPAKGRVSTGTPVPMVEVIDV